MFWFAELLQFVCRFFGALLCLLFLKYFVLVFFPSTISKNRDGLSSPFQLNNAVSFLRLFFSIILRIIGSDGFYFLSRFDM